MKILALVLTVVFVLFAITAATGICNAVPALGFDGSHHIKHAILYAVGLELYYCIGIVAAGGIGLVVTIQRMSKTYGQHGLTKRMALRNIPRALRGANRNYFISLNHLSDEKK